MSDSSSLRMLTSSASQYLHPDYLQPLPTTLDAKKSPLALLAQTCSSIGKDTTPGKSIIPPLEKSKDTNKSDSPASVKSSGTDGRKSTPNAEKREGSSPNGDKASFRTPAPKDIPPLVPISSGGEKSPRGSPETSTAKASEGTSGSSSTVATTASSHSGSKLNLSSSTLDLSHSESSSATSVPRSSSALVTSSLSKPEGLPTPATGSLPPTLPPYPGCGLPFMPHHLSALDPTSPSYHASLAAHSALASQKLGVGGLSSTPLPGTSPYVAYAHVKTASGATTLVPICRDPYCTNCQLTLQNTQLARCGAGCTQCNHDKTLPSASSLSASGLPLLPPSASSGLSASVSNPYAYPHSLGLLAGHHGLPYVCNWMSGSEYCGKRFTTSEELLQHLRTHTSSTDTAALASLPAYSLGLPTPSALGCHSHYSTPGSLSPNSLRSSYPRSLSPNSLLAANSRYHPYKPPGLSSLPTPPTLPSLPAGIAPYYSPYALYSQRLGAVGP